MADSLGCCHDTTGVPDIFRVSMAATVLHHAAGALQPVRAASGGAATRTTTSAPASQDFLHPDGVNLMMSRCVHPISNANSRIHIVLTKVVNRLGMRSGSVA